MSLLFTKIKNNIKRKDNYMKIKFSNEYYKSINNVIKNFIKEPTKDYIESKEDIEKIEKKMEEENTEIAKILKKYKQSLENVNNYEKAIAFQAGIQKGSSKF